MRFDKNYYEKHLGPVPCRPGVPEWEDHFSNIAWQIRQTIDPLSAIDLGCSFGMLVNHLNSHGIFAVGVDVSSYAISRRVWKNCRKADLLTLRPIWQFDLAICIEVLEHIPEKDAEKAIKKITSCADDVLFSATPEHTGEPTHLNIQPVAYWDSLFEKQGFSVDRSYDASYICGHARRYRK